MLLGLSQAFISKKAAASERAAVKAGLRPLDTTQLLGVGGNACVAECATTRLRQRVAFGQHFLKKLIGG
jgi:hypothetical protein